MPAGRPPKPTALKLLHGTARRDRVNASEPTPAVLDDARPPAWLKGRGRRAWRELVPVLSAMGVFTVADQVALSLLCDAYGEMVEARDAVAKYGTTYESKRLQGVDTRRADDADADEPPEALAWSVMIRPRPEVAIAADAWRRVNAMLQQFGMTPASRSKVAATGSDDAEDPFERFLKGS